MFRFSEVVTGGARRSIKSVSYSTFWHSIFSAKTRTKTTGLPRYDEIRPAGYDKIRRDAYAAHVRPGRLRRRNFRWPGRLISCGGHNRATGFSGYAFIANQEGGAIAAVDLEVFAVARHIRVDGSPTAVVANPRNARVYALTPENGSVHEIRRRRNLTFSRKLQVAATALEMRLSPAGDALYVLCRSPGNWCAWRWIRCRSAGLFRCRTIRPTSMSHPTETPRPSVPAPDAPLLSSIWSNRRSFPPLRTSGEIGLVRFQPFARQPPARESIREQLIAANVSQRMLSIFHVPSRRLDGKSAARGAAGSFVLQIRRRPIVCHRRRHGWGGGGISRITRRKSAKPCWPGIARARWRLPRLRAIFSWRIPSRRT